MIAEHMAKPFAWGASDCSFVFDIIFEMTGFDPIEDVRGYSTEAGAFKALKRAGFETTLDLVSEHFVEIPPGLAQRGDIGYPASIPNDLMSPAIFDGASAFSKEPSGGVIVPRDVIVRAWAV